MTPAAEPLPRGTVRVRWMPATPELGAALDRWRAMLDTVEQARADRYKFESDRQEYTAAHALLRTMLSRATGRPTAYWRYDNRERGKPRLEANCEADGLYFNISHTRGFVACAIAHAEVGIDVEAADRRVNFRIADRFFSPEETRLVNAAPYRHKARTFFRFWTLKEAFIKATGEGLARPLDSFSFSFDPTRIRFHPQRDEMRRTDDPRRWHFAEFAATPRRPVAVAIRWTTGRGPRFDAARIQPAAVHP